MANPADVLATLQWQVEEVSSMAREQARQHADVRSALKDLTESVETVRASFKPGSHAARILAGALAGRYEAARAILGE